MSSKTLTVLVSCLFPLLTRSAEVAGKVSVAQDGQGLAGVMVHVVSGIRPGAEPTNRATRDFAVRGGRLVPEVLVVRTGETFVVKNADAANYNVQFQFRENKGHNLILDAGGQLTARANRPELFARISEDLLRLRGYICVMEHPFYAVTDGDGAFILPDLPAGSYMIEAVHPRLGRLRKEITVAEKKSAVEFMFPNDVFSFITTPSTPLTGYRVAAVRITPIWVFGSPPKLYGIQQCSYWTDSAGHTILWPGNRARKAGDKQHRYTRICLGAISVSVPLPAKQMGVLAGILAAGFGFILIRWIIHDKDGLRKGITVTEKKSSVEFMLPGRSK